MTRLAWLTRLLFAGTDNFNHFERAILREVAFALPAEARVRLEARIAAVNRVQRLDGGREVNCFEMRGGNVVLSNATRIDDSSGERILARVRVDGAPKVRNSGCIWLVDGHFFSIEFDQSTEHATAGDIERITVKLEDR